MRRNAAGSGGGKRSGGPATPLLKWKFEDADSESGSEPASEKGSRKGRGRNAGYERDGIVSARKLAAGIWHVNGGLGFEVRNPFL